MPKEPLAPGESGRDPNEKHEVIKDQIIEREVIENEIIEIHAVGVPERKRLGEAVEAAFLAKATMLGFPVLKPGETAFLMTLGWMVGAGFGGCR